VVTTPVVTTPVQTPTATASPTITVGSTTPTAGGTPTVTASPTATGSPTATATSTQTVGATPSATTATATASPTITATSTATQTSTVRIVTVTVPVYYSSGRTYFPYSYYPRDYRYNYATNGILTVTSNPSDAVVIIDGYNYGRTPYIFTGLSPGYHTVEVDAQGYQAYITNVYLDPGQDSQIYADLTALVSHGSLFVDSSPQSADVYVDGNYEGTSPLTVSGLEAGSHRVELHHAGYEVAMVNEQVSPDQGTVADITLIPLSAGSGSGSIDVSTSVPGALVYLDGIYRGSIQSGTVFSIVAVSPGSHELLLHLPGYQDFTQTVAVNAGQEVSVSAAFTPLPAATQGSPSAPGGTGSVIVTTTPAGGQVTIDNAFRGVAPVTIYNIAAGSHIVNIHLDGYSDWSSTVDVPANQVTRVPATLVPAPGATPTRRTALSPAAVAGALCLAAAVAVRRRR